MNRPTTRITLDVSATDERELISFLKALCKRLGRDRAVRVRGIALEALP